MIRLVAIEGYRSLRDFRTPLGSLTVVTGANGSGKSNLYRALRLLADAARNGAVTALAREGGLQSTLWAGPATLSAAVRRGDHPVQGTASRGPKRLRMGFASDDYSYSMELGLPPPTDSPFQLDPEIKCEAVWHGPALKPSTLLCERRASHVRVRDESGAWSPMTVQVGPHDSILAEVASVDRTPELVLLRRQLASWRFYDHFRTDPGAPARRAQVGTRTPVLTNDGSDLAGALATIAEDGDRAALDKAVDDAFPGCTIEITTDGEFITTLRQPGMLRALPASELSDGTLRYLLLVAALLSPRPPELFVFNEPETSLHPDLQAPLAALIATVAATTQTVVVSHAAAFVDLLGGSLDSRVLQLKKSLGETRLPQQSLMDTATWHWPER
jgi:predicted ATPase